MTPKEKAENLVNKFLNIDKDYSKAKQCALLCVDEIIVSCDLLLFTAEIRYFEMVKQEINKL